MNQTIHIRPS